jgi:hypothetical protein
MFLQFARQDIGQLPYTGQFIGHGARLLPHGYGLEQVRLAHDDTEHDRAAGKLVVRVRH